MMTKLSVATCDRALAPGAAPEWVHLLAALASQDTTMDTDAAFRQRLADAMGLGPDATSEVMLALVTKMMTMIARATGKPDAAQATMAELKTAILTPDPAKYAPIEAVRSMLTERNTSPATQSQERAQTKVATAMRKGYLSPGMKDWEMALCASDEASFDAFVAGSIPPFAHITTSHDYMNVPPKTKGAGVGGSDIADAICAQLGLAQGALND